MPASLPPSPATVRTQIQEAAQAALDTADSLLAILDRMDGDVDVEDGGDAEPALVAPENHHGSQVVWLRGGDRDGEAEVPLIALQVVVAERVTVPIPSLPGAGGGT